jgi:diacylglycerol kinase (ATP)
MATQTVESGLRWSTTTVLLVVNPAAGGVTPALSESVTARLVAVAAEVRVQRTLGRGSVLDLAAAAGDADVVAVLGGDGTVRQVAEGLLRGAGRWPGRVAAGETGASGPAGRSGPAGGPGPALLVLPAGRGNSTARNLWGSGDCAQVLDTALAGGERRPLDVLRLVEPDACAVLGASSGFLAEVLIQATVVAGAGRDRYLIAGADVLARPPRQPTRVTVDGHVVSDGPASVVAVGGGSYRATDFQFLPGASLHDGLLDVCVIDALSPARAAELPGLLLAGAHLGQPDVRCAQGRRAVIEATDGRPLVVELDGEVWAGAGCRLTAEVLPAALEVLVPAPASHPAPFPAPEPPAPEPPAPEPPAPERPAPAGSGTDHPEETT